MSENLFTGRLVLTVEVEAMDLDREVVASNLEALVRERLEQWPNEVVRTTVNTEYFSA